MATEIDDYKIEFERRRYGSGSFFTWAYIVSESGEYLSLGDPWPAVQFPINELKRMVANFAKRINGETK